MADLNATWTRWDCRRQHRVSDRALARILKLPVLPVQNDHFSKIYVASFSYLSHYKTKMLPVLANFCQSSRLADGSLAKALALSDASQSPLSTQLQRGLGHIEHCHTQLASRPAVCLIEEGSSAQSNARRRTLYNTCTLNPFLMYFMSRPMLHGLCYMN